MGSKGGNLYHQNDHSSTNIAGSQVKLDSPSRHDFPAPAGTVPQIRSPTEKSVQAIDVKDIGK